MFFSVRIIQKIIQLFFIFIALISCESSSFNAYNNIETGDNVTTPPKGFPPFYKKYLNASGIPILASDNVRDEALVRARKTVINMLSSRPDVLAQMILNKVRVGIVADEEVTSDLPEYSDVENKEEFNSRARGYGGSPDEPFASVAEENLMRDGRKNYPVREDKWYTMDVFVHEFAHAIHLNGLNYTDKEFEKKLTKLYKDALNKGLWKNTYAGTNIREYFAECVGAWFDVKAEGPSVEGDGTNNSINTRKELNEYDPDMYDFLAKIFPDSKWLPAPLNKN